MTEAAMLLYLVAAFIFASATFALSKCWRDVRQPGTHPALLSVLAGLLWPLLVVGVVQFGSVALVVSMMRNQRGVAA